MDQRPANEDGYGGRSRQMRNAAYLIQCPIVLLLQSSGMRMTALLQRPDIGGKIGRLSPAQIHIRHFRVRVDQK